MPIWSDIERALSPDAADREFAARVAMELREGSPLARTQTSLLRASDGAIASFYASLEATRSPPEPRSRAADSSWLLRSDVCWINVRACAIDGRPGSFIRASKLLPGIASDAILLAPFHPIQFDLTYAPETMTIVDPALADSALSAAGISPAAQLRAFVTACRLLDRSVGYELLPYAAQFSRIAMERPGLFRWVALDDDRKGLAHADPAFPYCAGDRLRDSDRVAAMAAAAKNEYGISTFRKHEDDSPELSAAKDKAYFGAIRLCVDNGLWPVPAHARHGVGIPAFLRYDGAGDFPVFSYRDVDGLDIGEDAYGVVAPFAFYDDVPPNASPAGSVPRNDDAIDYYAHVFSYWRDSFGFDFVRYNAVDRVFDEAVDEEGLMPASDRPTPEVVTAAIMASRDGAAGTGAIAARKGSEVERYAALGFDLTMGNEVLRRIDAPLVSDSFALHDTLAGRARGKRPASVCFAVDVPESGAPRLWGSALSKVMGSERMRLRHGMARFLSVGKGRRPMFETMGFQDGSTGLYEAGFSIRGLDWADDAGLASGYASIERLYARLRPFLDAGAIIARSVEDGHAWWQVSGKGRSRLVAVVASLETAEGCAPGRLSIPLDPAWGDLEGRAYRLPDSVGIGIEARGSIELDLGFLDLVVVDLVPVFY
ncbi:MAG: hypothetical protein CVV51_08330 [Spirochaetae bacterium HGW-Spirochaetae-7]|jgi:hypothetical protein|nr:MAG: hypothetical protein CVV51_08330 [Spirochaetae bacterium HGW-Spirochaetae-7]